MNFKQQMSNVTNLWITIELLVLFSNAVFSDHIRQTWSHSSLSCWLILGLKIGLGVTDLISNTSDLFWEYMYIQVEYILSCSIVTKVNWAVTCRILPQKLDRARISPVNISESRALPLEHHNVYGNMCIKGRQGQDQDNRGHALQEISGLEIDSKRYHHRVLTLFTKQHLMLWELTFMCISQRHGNVYSCKIYTWMC